MWKWIAVVVLAGPVTAQEFIPRATDQVLDAAAMQAEVVGRTHEFFDGGVSFFSISGTYSYTYSDGGRAYGEWTLRDDGEGGVICTSFSAGFARCDMYVHDGDRLVLITEDGVRFPVRDVS